MHYLLTSAILAGLVSLSPLSVQAASITHDVSVFSEDVAGLTPAVDAFRSSLGPLNAPAPVNGDPSGRRQINWDAAPDFVSDPNPFPGDFFNFPAAPRARGIEFRETGDTEGFVLSATDASGVDPRFGFEDDFVPFSEERMFTPVGGNTFDVLFFDPANPSNPALSRGLGVIFNDVDLADTTSISLFDINDILLETRFAEAGPSGGLSFVGLIFDEAVISRASITVGNSVFLSNGQFGHGSDGVVMDDFIFGEPVVSPVPLPAGLVLMGSALAGLGTVVARRRRQ